MNKNFLAFLLLLSLGSSQLTYTGRTGRGFGIGAVTGLAAGIITSKIAANSAPAPIAVPVTMAPAAYYVYEEDPCIAEQRAELRVRERQMYEAQMQQRKRDEEQRQREEERRYREQVRQERQARQEHQNQLMQQKPREAKLVTFQPIPDEVKQVNSSRELALKERELTLKEQQVQLELVKEKNKRKELELKDKELEIQLIRARRENNRKN